MKLMFDIGHPAHVHYFKYAIKELRNKGHQIKVTARNRPLIFELLNKYDIEFVNRGNGSDDLIGKLLYMVKADFFLHRIVKEFKPDLMINFGAVYNSQVSWFNGISNITIDDTDHAKVNHFFYRYFAGMILTPSCFGRNFGKKHLTFPSYMELAYLHPSWFEPDESVLDILNVKRDEKYTVVRFVGWDALHDVGQKGISLENRIYAVNEFSKHSKVFISSEKDLPDALKQYEIDIPVHRMHDALAYASLFYGESATMASESAVLGTPAIYLDNESRGYTKEQEAEYGMVFNYSQSNEDQLKSINKGKQILVEGNKENWKARRMKLLEEKIDLTSFLVWLIDSYPNSKDKITKQSDIWNNFLLAK